MTRACAVIEAPGGQHERARFALWCAVGLLTAIGVVAVIGRGLYLADLPTRASVAEV